MIMVQELMDEAATRHVQGDLESTTAGGDDDDDGGGRSGHGRFVGFEGEGGDGELSAVTVGIITKANNSDNFNRAWKLPILI